MEFHPFAEKLPFIEDGPEWEAFKASIKATGGIKDNPILYREVNGQAQGLDGRNRAKACKELRIKPKYKKVKVKDEDVKTFILRHNVLRRHLTPEMRRAIVAELREDGQSTRQIAETLGTSKDTVHRDLQELAESGVSNETTGPENPSEKLRPATVTGRDGKSYPATKGASGVTLCERCQRVGKVMDCQACKELARPKPKKKPGRPSYSWKHVNDGVGVLARQITVVAKLGNVPLNSPKVEAFKSRLETYVKDFKDWYAEVTAQTPKG
jgi:transposase-like protein